MCLNRLCTSTASLLVALAGAGFLALGSDADVIIDLTYIGNPGNTADDTGVGAVDYEYFIGTYELTVAQYTEFLNAAAKSDPYGLYSESMETSPLGPSILRSGSDGSYSYNVVAGKGDQPVRWVSLYDGMRFCNWMHNGEGTNDTETGSYDLSLGAYATREPGATWVIPSQDEWYKAAYYDPGSGDYYDYPNGTDDVPAEPTDETTPRAMNFGDDPYWGGPGVVFTSIGDTTGQSPYGTYNQGGNVEEWTDTQDAPPYQHYRLMRGGWFGADEVQLRSSDYSPRTPDTEGAGFGFRLGFSIPEPGTLLLLLVALPVLIWLKER